MNVTTQSHGDRQSVLRRPGPSALQRERACLFCSAPRRGAISQPPGSAAVPAAVWARRTAARLHPAPSDLIIRLGGGRPRPPYARPIAPRRGALQKRRRMRSSWRAEGSLFEAASPKNGSRPPVVWACSHRNRYRYSGSLSIDRNANDIADNPG